MSACKNCDNETCDTNRECDECMALAARMQLPCGHSFEKYGHEYAENGCVACEQDGARNDRKYSKLLAERLSAERDQLNDETKSRLAHLEAIEAAMKLLDTIVITSEDIPSTPTECFRGIVDIFELIRKGIKDNG